MIKRVISIFICVTVLFSASGCGSHKEILAELKGNKTLGIWIGQICRLEVESNPTTGYSWELSGDIDKGIVQEVGKYKYIRKSDLVGGGGKQVYRLKGQKKGVANLILEYKRPWEKGIPPAKTYKVKIIVH